MIVRDQINAKLQFSQLSIGDVIFIVNDESEKIIIIYKYR